MEEKIKNTIKILEEAKKQNPNIKSIEIVNHKDIGDQEDYNFEPLIKIEYFN